MQVQALRFTARIKTKTAKQLFQLVVHLNKVVVTKFLDGVVKFQNSLLTLSLKSRKRSTNTRFECSTLRLFWMRQKAQ